MKIRIPEKMLEQNLMSSLGPKQQLGTPPMDRIGSTDGWSKDGCDASVERLS